MKEQIIKIRTKAKKEIYYLINSDYLDSKKEIEENYNMGLIYFGEMLSQLEAITKKALRELKENGIEDEIINR